MKEVPSVSARVPTRAKHHVAAIIPVLAAPILGLLVAQGRLLPAMVVPAAGASVVIGRRAPNDLKVATLAAIAGLTTGLGGSVAGPLTAVAGLALSVMDWGKVRRFRPSVPLMALAGSLSVLWLGSSLINVGSVIPVRPLLTRLLVLPVLVGLMTATALSDSAGRMRLGHRVPTVLVLTGAIGTLIVLFFGGIQERQAPFSTAIGAWSTFLIVACLAGFWLYRQGHRRAFVPLSIVVIGLLLAATRSSALVAFVGAAVVSFTDGDRLAPSGARARRLGVVVLTIAMPLALLSPVGNPLMERFFEPDVGTARSTSNRVALSAIAFDLALENPAWGVGPGEFGDYVVAGIGGPEWAEVVDLPGAAPETHNHFTRMLAEFGLAAFLAYLVFVVLIARTAWRCFRQEVWIPLSLCALLVTGLVQNIELHESYSILLGLSLAPAIARLRTGSP